MSIASEVESMPPQELLNKAAERIRTDTTEAAVDLTNEDMRMAMWDLMHERQLVREPDHSLRRVSPKV